MKQLPPASPTLAPKTHEAEQAQHGAADAQTTLGALDQPLDGADEAEPFAFRW